MRGGNYQLEGGITSKPLMFQTSSSEIFSFSLIFSVIFQCTIYFLCLAFNRWFWRNVSEGPSSCIDKGTLCCVRHTLREPHAQIRNMIYHGPILRLTVFGIVLGNPSKTFQRILPVKGGGVPPLSAKEKIFLFAPLIFR